jgi:hypothetical protein
MSKIISYSIGWLALILSSAAWSTGPGTPMDCTDLILAPGLTCTQASDPGTRVYFSGSISVLDNDGRILSRASNAQEDVIRELGSCGGHTLRQMALVYYVNEKDGLRTPIISANDRCLDPSTSTVESIGVGYLLFDAVKGELVFNPVSICRGPVDEHGNPVGGSCPYTGGGWIARIKGFTPLLTALRAIKP